MTGSLKAGFLNVEAKRDLMLNNHRRAKIRNRSFYIFCDLKKWIGLNTFNKILKSKKLYLGKTNELIQDDISITTFGLKKRQSG